MPETPLFIGEDVTDEAGFDAVNDLSGYSGKVGGGVTAAAFGLADIDAVYDWLREAVREQEI